MGKLFQFRRLKRGAPDKFKDQAEDIRLDGRHYISWPTFTILVTVAAVLISAAVMMAGDYPFGQ